VSRVTFIGTSDAFGAGGRRQSAILIESASGALLVDCAPTTGTGLADLGIPRDAIDAIAVSHFHGDHFAGIPAFLLAAIYEDRRRHALQIAGPPGVEARVRTAADAMGYGLGDHEMPFALRFVELPADQRVDLGAAHVRSFAVHHQPDSCPHGLDLEVDGRRIVFSGDTGWFDDLPRHTRGADLFICECTFHEPVMPEHMAYSELLGRAPRFACERLLLTHLGASMHDRRGQLELETADDGLRIEV
jgi:ribonuclease BN (tRNA processing enzyme)